jgi:hypothetical protein
MKHLLFIIPIELDAERLAFLVATPMWEEIDTEMGKLVGQLLTPYSGHRKVM